MSGRRDGVVLRYWRKKEVCSGVDSFYKLFCSGDEARNGPMDLSQFGLSRGGDSA